jgi:hypothetical protein
MQNSLLFAILAFPLAAELNLYRTRIILDSVVICHPIQMLYDDSLFLGVIIIEL